MKELQPINQNVLLEITEDKSEQKTARGIIIPNSAKEKNKLAKVLAVSNIGSSEISVGETVLYKEFAGSEVNFEGSTYLLMPYDSILAKVVETENI